MVVGESGSGKSNVLMQQIISRHAAGQQLHIVDPKEELEPIFGRHASVVGVEGCRAKFKELLELAAARRTLFKVTSEMCECPVRDYREYKKTTGEDLPVVCLAVDELIMVSGEIGENDLIKLLVTGRSAGVFLLCLSQYLKADILSRKGSINFTTRVYLGRYDRISCGLLFGNYSKEDENAWVKHLGPPGNAVVMRNGHWETARMPLVNPPKLTPFLRRS